MTAGTQPKTRSALTDGGKVADPTATGTTAVTDCPPGFGFLCVGERGSTAATDGKATLARKAIPVSLEKWVILAFLDLLEIRGTREIREQRYVTIRRQPNTPPVI